MIISHKHKFIFIKLRKTAGTSIEMALAGICGEEDIITPISKEDEKARLELGCQGAQNYDVPMRYYGITDWKNRIFKGKKKYYYNHMPATEIKANIPVDIWSDYFKFCFERNPWDKTISHYFHRNRSGDFSSIMDYLRHDEGDMIRGFDMYSIDGKVAVDKVFAYEKMETALEEVSVILNLPDKLTLPEYRAKSEFRTDKRPYSEILTEEEASAIADRYAREIDLMGYKY